MQNSSSSLRRSPVQSIDRAVAILNVIRDAGAPLPLSKIAERTGLTRSTVHRLLSSMLVHGLVEQDAPGSVYAIGPRIAELAQEVMPVIQRLVMRAQPIMDALRDETGETIGLHVRKGIAHRLVVGQSMSHLELRRTYAEIGDSLPIYQGAPGKLLLAHLPEQQLEEILRGQLTPVTERTIVDADRLREQLVEIRAQGFALSFQERNPGVSTVAVGLPSSSGEITQALSLTGPSVRLPRERLIQWVPQLKAAAARIGEVAETLSGGR
jgi:IclR family acetate operon transcriptional repressor